MRSVCIVIAAIFLAGCASTGDVMQMGPDTYSVSSAAAPARGGPAAARSLALKEANAFCAAQGKQIMVMNVSTSTLNDFGAGSADVNFRCLTQGDQELQRPVYENSPDIVIESR